MFQYEEYLVSDLSIVIIIIVPGHKRMSGTYYAHQHMQSDPDQAVAEAEKGSEFGKPEGE